MSAESRVTPPSVGDVLWAARAYNWPALRGGVAIAAGEAAWRAAVTEATASDVWAALHEVDEIEADVDEEDHE